ncbi:unnamed protein product [Pseudo-nitzschia multistriata]|uniref:Uncharacterized protein n=1 Tax=Pseudo-nitzschia multistriata TaxID=183589 RepID=A0A448ZAE8_9STRA|nr:unnamed protein product [Pseudo-nitzschia multistriata]
MWTRAPCLKRLQCVASTGMGAAKILPSATAASRICRLLSAATIPDAATPHPPSGRDPLRRLPFSVASWYKRAMAVAPEPPCSHRCYHRSSSHDGTGFLPRSSLSPVATRHLVHAFRSRSLATAKRSQRPRPAAPRKPWQKKRQRMPQIATVLRGMGISSADCSSALVRACSEVRGIPLNKRQRSKPWIMALLMHRYDRGIRCPNELNTDSVYYGDQQTTQSTSTGEAIIAIDLREALTPSPSEVRGYLSLPKRAKADGTKTPPSPRAAEEALRTEKLALLATEARRIVVDRRIPLGEMASLGTEANARRLSKQDPASFLAIFSRAVAAVEVGRTAAETRPADFSHRRFRPPSLRKSVYRARKREQRRGAEAARRNAARGGPFQRGHHPSSLVRTKLAETNRR